MKELKIKKNEANQRADKFLAKYLDKATKSFIYKMMRKKNITLNDKKMEGNEKLEVGDVVKIFFSDETLEKFTSANKQSDKKSNFSGISGINKESIIFEDENILLFNKPAGMLSQKSDINDVSANEHIIKYMIESHKISEEDFKTFKPSVCNRLDRNTSGLLIFGKSLLGLQAMAELLKSRNIHKYYLCIVNGVISKEEEISGYLKKDTNNNIVKISEKDNGGDFIRTKYVPICNNGNLTLLKVLLITGKTHQIRAHLSSINHPIIGDAKYGKPQMNFQIRNRYGLNRQLLHSYEISFENVENGLKYLNGKSFKASPDKMFREIMNGENLYGNLE